MKAYRKNQALMNRNDGITEEDVHIFCKELRTSILSTNFDGKTEKEIFGEIFTRVRSGLWYKMRENSKLRLLFSNNLKYISRYMPENIQNITDYIINSVLQGTFPEDPYNDIRLSIAAMSHMIDESESINKSADTLNKQWVQAISNMNMENDNV